MLNRIIDSSGKDLINLNNIETKPYFIKYGKTSHGKNGEFFTGTQKNCLNNTRVNAGEYQGFFERLTSSNISPHIVNKIYYITKKNELLEISQYGVDKTNFSVIISPTVRTFSLYRYTSNYFSYPSAIALNIPSDNNLKSLSLNTNTCMTTRDLYLPKCEFLHAYDSNGSIRALHNLENLYISTSIGTFILSSCHTLKNISYINSVSFPHIRMLSLAYCHSLENIPNNILSFYGSNLPITSLSQDYCQYAAIYSPSLLNNISLPLVSYLYISNCWNLNTCFIGASSISASFFYSTNLMSLYLPNPFVVSIANSNCFPAGFKNGGTLYVPSSLVASYKANTSWATMPNLNIVSYEFPSNILYGYHYGFGRYTSSIFSGSYTAIGARAFYSCPNLKEVNISNCKFVAGEAFSGCANISSINIGSAYMPYMYLQSASNLRYLNAPNLDGCTTIFSNITYFNNANGSTVYTLANYINASINSSVEEIDLIELPKLSSLNPMNTLTVKSKPPKINILKLKEINHIAYCTIRDTNYNAINSTEGFISNIIVDSNDYLKISGTSSSDSITPIQTIDNIFLFNKFNLDYTKTEIFNRVFIEPKIFNEIIRTSYISSGERADNVLSREPLNTLSVEIQNTILQHIDPNYKSYLDLGYRKIAFNEGTDFYPYIFHGKNLIDLIRNDSSIKLVGNYLIFKLEAVAKQRIFYSYMAEEWKDTALFTKYFTTDVSNISVRENIQNLAVFNGSWDDIVFSEYGEHYFDLNTYEPTRRIVIINPNPNKKIKIVIEKINGNLGNPTILSGSTVITDAPITGDKITLEISAVFGDDFKFGEYVMRIEESD